MSRWHCVIDVLKIIEHCKLNGMSNALWDIKSCNVIICLIYGNVCKWLRLGMLIFKTRAGKWPD